jgi:hypothetical protein
MVVQSVVFVVALVVLVVWFSRLLERREEAWSDERAGLLNHLQSGERMPTASSSWTPRPAPEPDQITKVGHIDFEDAA